MKKRATSAEERALFETSLEQYRPRALAKRPARKKGLAAAGGSGLDGSTAEKLKRGQIVPDARVDLHGLTEDKAHDVLLSFLRRTQQAGGKLVLVITGKGNPPATEGAAWTLRRHGVLKEMVPRWLNEKAFATLIAGSRPAHRRHGGDGALYVYLRKG